MKRLLYLRNKSTELDHNVPSFPEQITSRKGIVTFSFQYCAADYAGYLVFSISLGPTYFRMSFHVLKVFWWAVLKGVEEKLGGPQFFLDGIWGALNAKR